MGCTVKGICSFDGFCLYYGAPDSELLPAVEMDHLWQVDTEVPIDGGYLDLLLRHPAAGTCIVLENKIDAADQRRQLYRYQEWQLNQSGVQHALQRLVYLTPEGRAPSKSAWGRASRSPPSGDYFLLCSYRRGVAQALFSSLSEIKSDEVRFVTQQYASLIRSL